MKPIEINLKKDVSLMKILDDFVEDQEGIPTEEGKKFFREWEGIVPTKLIRSCIFAGMHYALKNKDNLDIKWADNTDHVCPECGGAIEKVIIKDPHAWRWTCKKCGRDFGYNTDKPINEDTDTILKKAG
ncbi:MAG: hypothetical protein AMJ90_06785 [candidate division Zixibacteria bacterium SM23_73_2]|nr:MAG: hypothetical protein AMJ90_06785 [candidate division Zixibacteria bacterium SM23_73_2]